MKGYEWELVEFFPDGSEIVRHTGSFDVCSVMADQFMRCGFTVDVRRAAANVAQ